MGNRKSTGEATETKRGKSLNSNLVGKKFPWRVILLSWQGIVSAGCYWGGGGGISFPMICLERLSLFCRVPLLFEFCSQAQKCTNGPANLACNLALLFEFCSLAQKCTNGPANKAVVVRSLGNQNMPRSRLALGNTSW